MANPFAEEIVSTGAAFTFTGNQTTLHLSVISLDIDIDRPRYQRTHTQRSRATVDTAPGQDYSYDWFSEITLSGVGIFDPDVADGPSFFFPTRDTTISSPTSLTVQFPAKAGDSTGAIWTGSGAFTNWRISGALEALATVSFEWVYDGNVAIIQGS